MKKNWLFINTVAVQGLERLGSRGVLSLVIVVVVDPQEWDPFNNGVMYQFTSLLIHNNISNIIFHFFNSNVFNNSLSVHGMNEPLHA